MYVGDGAAVGGRPPHVLHERDDAHDVVRARLRIPGRHGDGMGHMGEMMFIGQWDHGQMCAAHEMREGEIRVKMMK